MTKLYKVKVGETASLWTNHYYVAARTISEAEKKAKKRLLKEHGRGFCVTEVAELADEIVT